VYRKRTSEISLAGGLSTKDGGSGREAEAVSSTRYGVSGPEERAFLAVCMASEKILNSPNRFRLSWNASVGVGVQLPPPLGL